MNQEGSRIVPSSPTSKFLNATDDNLICSQTVYISSCQVCKCYKRLVWMANRGIQGEPEHERAWTGPAEMGTNAYQDLPFSLSDAGFAK